MDGHPQRGIKKVIVTTWHHVQEKRRESFVHSGHLDTPLEQKGASLLVASFGTRQLGLGEGVLVSRSGRLGRLRPIARRSRRSSNSTRAFVHWRGRGNRNTAWRKAIGGLAPILHAALTLQDEIGPGLDRTTTGRRSFANGF